MSGKRLEWQNGEIQNAQDCSDCSADRLPPTYHYCPFCGEELDD